MVIFELNTELRTLISHENKGLSSFLHRFVIHSLPIAARLNVHTTIS
jgi:hypothetical protein